MAPSVVTLMRRMPQTMASISSTKAQVDVSRVAMTSPDGPVGVPPVAEPDQVVVAVGDGAAERAQRGAPVEPAADAPEHRRGHQDDRVGDDQRAEGVPQVLVLPSRCAMRPSRAAKISGAATALARVPSTMAAQLPANAARSGSHLAPAVGQRGSGRCIGEEGAFTHGILQTGGRGRGRVEASGRTVARRCDGAGSEGAGRSARRCTRSASVAGGAEVGPGHAGPPSGGTAKRRQGHDGAREQLHAASSFLPSGHLASVSWCNSKTRSASVRRCAQEERIRARSAPAGGPLRRAGACSLRSAPSAAPRDPGAPRRARSPPGPAPCAGSARSAAGYGSYASSIVSVSSPTHCASVVRPTGWPPKRVHSVVEDGPVDLVEAQLVHAEELEPVAGRGAVDEALAAHLGEVPHPPQEPVGHPRRAPGALRDPDRTLGVDAHLQDAGRALHDGAQVGRVVEVQPADEAEAVPQRARRRARCGSSHRPG